MKEPPGLSRDDGTRQVSDGVTLLPWAKDKLLAWDVTVPDIMPTHFADTATTAGATAGRRTVTKKPVGLPAAGQQPHLCTSCQLSQRQPGLGGKK